MCATVQATINLFCSGRNAEINQTFKSFLSCLGWCLSIDETSFFQMVVKPTETLNPLAFWGGVACCITYTLDFLLNLNYSHPRLYFMLTHNKL